MAFEFMCFVIFLYNNVNLFSNKLLFFLFLSVQRRKRVTTESFLFLILKEKIREK
jgi:hypothetical protein